MFGSPYSVRNSVVACVLVLAASALAGPQTGLAAPPDVLPLVAILKSDATAFEKATACRQLSVVGNREAVSALAALLPDPELSTYARWALENIPDPAADEVLRTAIGQVEGDSLLGVLASIGKRRDAQAVEPLVKLLANSHPTVASAAARTLGAIGNGPAAEVLTKMLAEGTPALRPAVAWSCLLCGERLAEQGQRTQAVALYDAVRKADVPQHVALAATHRAIVARGREGLALLAEELTATDEARFRLGLQAARDLGRAASGALTARFDNASPARQALLVLALSDLGDPGALPTILAAVKSDAKEVRIEALAALGRFGTAAAVAPLLDAAVDPDEQVAQTARTALATLDSGEINQAITDMLRGDHLRTLHVAVTLAGERGLASATPALFQLAEHQDAVVGSTAVKALGSTVALEDLPKLIARMISGSPAKLQADWAAAVKAACARLPRDACADRLTAAMSGTTAEARVAVLEQLALVGGSQALVAVVAAARAPDDYLQDAATRLLGGWMSPDAAPPLFDLAKSADSPKYRVRALRGYLRIARQLSLTAEERLEVCRNALAVAERKEDKVLAVETLGRVGLPKALTFAVSLLQDDNLKDAACSAILTMSDAVALTAPEDTERAIVQVLGLATTPQLKERAEKQLAKAHELALQHREDPQFVPLFDGLTLSGWEGDPTVFRVEDGALVGGSLKKPIGRGNDFLCTQKAFRDFELRLQFKLVGESPNGGVNLRSKRNPDDGVASGYQADLGAGYWGCLYDEARRNRVLVTANPQPEIRPGEWNDYRIRCEGRRIRLWVNGIQTVDYNEQDANIPVDGIIALQVQANRPSEAWYRNLRVREL